VRSGVSLISAEQACENAEREIPDFDIINVANAARAQWNEVLGTVEVEIAQGQDDLRVLFYSSVSPA
jgi:putative alpha-1,2-mannosidase